jgi:saccharopine dehydrogenase-like NADP-dependent oxidoreductase
MNKKILVLGAGAQGIVIIKMMNEHSMVDELVCIDADDLMFDELTSKFKKLKCFKIDCSEKENITDFASKYKFDIFVNCLPISIGKPVMDAAIELKVNYQDLAISEYMITGEITDD